MTWGLLGTRLRNARNQLANAPLAFARPTAQGAVSWGMYLDEASLHRDGIYSTCFAIELLARSPRAREDKTVAAIVGGVKFLVAQYENHCRLRDGHEAVGKQADKKRQLGHTDYDLVLKHAQTLEAIGVLPSLKNAAAPYDDLLGEVHSVATDIARELRSIAVDLVTDGRNLTAWPWHRIDPSRRPDPIPTAYAYKALKNELFLGHANMVGAKKVEPYLVSALSDDRVRPVPKAVVLNTLASLGGIDSIDQAGRRVVQDVVDGELSPEAGAGWQETYHYEIAVAEGLSHYKPWLWLCPRIELAQADLLLREGDFSAQTLATVHAVVTIVERYGSFRVSASKPPTLQACWRAEQLLRLAQRFYDA